MGYIIDTIDAAAAFPVGSRVEWPKAVLASRRFGTVVDAKRYSLASFYFRHGGAFYNTSKPFSHGPYIAVEYGDGSIGSLFPSVIHVVDSAAQKAVEQADKDFPVGTRVWTEIDGFATVIAAKPTAKGAQVSGGAFAYEKYFDDGLSGPYVNLKLDDGRITNRSPASLRVVLAKYEVVGLLLRRV